MRRLLGIVIVLLGWVSGQGFTGVFEGQAGAGPVVLDLVERGGDLEGSLVGSDVRFEIVGFLQDGVGVGMAHTADGSVGFEAHLQGDTLGLYLFELDALGEPVVESVVELLLTRRGGGATAGAPPPFGADAPPAVGPLAGTFADERLTLRIDGAPGAYSASVESGGQTYLLDVYESRDGLVGSFESGGHVYTFAAHLEGDVLVFETAGTTYRLARQGSSAQPDPFAAPTGPAPPPAAGGASQGGAGSVVLAHGRFASLTHDDAVAFVEALEFVLEQLGYPYRFSEAERQEALRAIAAYFPIAEQPEQLVLADARAIWTRARANWHAASEPEQREFALGVLVLAFGEATVRQWMGSGGGGGGGQGLGGGACGSFEECTSRFVDERTWTDTFNSQGCWAAAGCESYDSGSGTFTYSDDY